MRQRLVKDSKFSKYLLYAIGEIILVVIGILIALQLNNWNTENKASIEELELLAEMKYNLELDLKDCIWNIKKNQDLLASNLAVISHLKERTPFHDALRVHYGNLVYTTTQLRNMSAYDHLKSKGMNLVQNDSLRQEITTVYSARYYYIERRELEYDNKIQINHIIPQLNGKVVIDDVTKTGYPMAIENLYDDDAFKGALHTNVNVKRSMANAYENLEADLQNLIAHITKELKRRKR